MTNADPGNYPTIKPGRYPLCNIRNFAHMYYVRLLLLYLSGTALLFLIMGLIRPWLMLWWEDVQNRRKVLKVYGSMALIFYIFYWALYFVIK